MVDIEKLNRRLGIQLPTSENISSVFKDGADQADYLYNRNEVYTSRGSSLIKMAYVMYLYLNCPNTSLTRIPFCIDRKTSETIKMVYYENGLNDIMPCEKYEETVLRLLVVIYQEYGLYKVYQLLLPFFKKLAIEEVVPEKMPKIPDDKVLMKNYKAMDPRQFLRLYCQYTGTKKVMSYYTVKEPEFKMKEWKKRHYIHVSTPVTPYRIQLSVNNHEVVSRCNIIGMAEHTLVEKALYKHIADAFLKKYYRLPQKLAQRQRRDAERSILIKKEREQAKEWGSEKDRSMLWNNFLVEIKKHIEEIDALNTVTSDQLRMILSKNFYIAKQDYFIERMSSHNGLMVTSFYIMEWLTKEFVFANFRIDDDHFKSYTKEIIASNELGDFLPNESFWSEYFQAWKTPNAFNNKDFQRLRSRVMMRLLGTLWLTCLTKEDRAFQKKVKMFSYQIVEKMIEKIYQKKINKIVKNEKRLTRDGSMSYTVSYMPFVVHENDIPYWC